MDLQQLILEAWTNRELLKDAKYSDAVKAVIEEVDKGRLRTAAPTENGWQVNEWVKQAILMYFAVQPMETIDMPPFEFHDKIPLKKDFKSLGVRTIPGASGTVWRLYSKECNSITKLYKYWCICR